MRTPAAEPTAEAVPKTRVPATAEAAINNAVSTLTTDRAEESAGLGATKLRRSRASLLSAVLIAGILIVWTGPWPRQEDLPWAALTEAKAAWTRSQPVLERLRSRLETLAIELGLPIWSAGGDPAQTADARPHLRNEQASQVPEGDVASSAFSAAPPVPLPGESEPSLLTITQPAGAGDVAEVAPSGSAAPDLLEAATDVEPPIPSRDVDEVVQDPEPSLRASIAMPQQSVTTEHSTREADGSTASAEPLQSTRTARDVPGKALDVAAQAEGERFFVQFGSFRTEAVARSDCAVFKGLAEVSATSGRDGAQWYVCRTMTSKDKEYGLGLIGTIEAAMNLKAVLVRDHRR